MKTKKIYKVCVDDWSYDEYDAVIVCARSRNDAIKIACKKCAMIKEKCKVEMVGYAKSTLKTDVILASFNAG